MVSTIVLGVSMNDQTNNSVDEQVLQHLDEPLKDDVEVVSSQHFDGSGSVVVETHKDLETIMTELRWQLEPVFKWVSMIDKEQLA